MAKALSFSPFQIASPVQLLFCLILFFLPWVEVQCSLPSSKIKEMPPQMVEAAKKEMGIDPTKSISMFSQSGWQIATGDISPGSDLKKMMEKDKGKGGGKKPGGGDEPGPMGGPNLGPDPDAMNKQMKDESGSAPLLYLYPVALLGGIVCGLLPIMPMVRRILTAGCCAAAFGVVALQCLIGFPIENELKKQNEEAKQQMSALGKMPGPAPRGNAKDAKADKGKTDSKGDADIFRTSYQFALYLSFLLLVTAGATAFLDALAGGGGKSARRKKSRYDDEDEEDEEEDRPRKKKRRDEDDEEDDRPRKKRRDEEEEEDDRPRKKRPVSRDEDEEEDERPRKKKPADRDEGDEDDRPRKKKPQGEFTFGEEPAAPAPAAPAPAPAPPPAAPAAPAPAGGNPFAFDEDEPKPKKKPRPRDEDDEDDRPRKKRRRDDDD
jgi:hypothetical protein